MCVCAYKIRVELILIPLPPPNPRLLALHRCEGLQSPAALSYDREGARPCLHHTETIHSHLPRVEGTLQSDIHKFSRKVSLSGTINCWISTSIHSHNPPSPIPNLHSRTSDFNFSGLLSWQQRAWLHTSSWSWFPEGPDQPKGNQPMAAKPVDALHAPVGDAVPDKKAASKLGEKKPKIEMAVDTIKKKKQKTADVIEKVST